MKNFNKRILEAVQKGVRLALDDYEPDDTITSDNYKDVQSDVIDSFGNISDILMFGGFVDLGLKSGTKWCKCNIGAKDENYYGQLFSWGEIEQKEHYYDCSYKHYESFTDWSNYKEGEDRFKYSCYNVVCKLKKYCTNPSEGFEGFTDNITQLLPEDDVATHNANCSRYKIPTEEDFRELLNETDVEWDGEKRGYKFMCKSDHDKYIFMPLAGFKMDDVGRWFDNGKKHALDYEGIYWSSTLNEYNPHEAMTLDFVTTSGPSIKSSKRFFGFSVRPVVK